VGLRARAKPHRLAEKLLQIRVSLGLSQSELMDHLNLRDMITYNRISKFESGSSEPPLVILLQYARAAGVHMEDLVDDRLDLPNKLPSTVVHPDRKVSRNKPAGSRKR